MMPHFPHGLSVVEKFCASVSLDCCIIPDEMELKQLEVTLCIAAPSLVIFIFLGNGRAIVDGVYSDNANPKKVIPFALCFLSTSCWLHVDCFNQFVGSRKGVGRHSVNHYSSHVHGLAMVYPLSYGGCLMLREIIICVGP